MTLPKSPIKALECRRKMSISKKGKSSWNKNKNHPKYKEYINKMSEFMKNRITTEETRKKMSKSASGRLLSDESKHKISEANKGNKNPYYGKHHTLEIRKKIGARPYPTKENHPWWKGGISNEPYSFDFNEELKMLIRKRDNFECQICGGPGVIVHHINYIKKDSRPENLTTLCEKCHGKTNYNRWEWVYYFKGLI